MNTICIANRSAKLTDDDVERAAMAIANQLKTAVARYWPISIDVVSCNAKDQVPFRMWPLFVYDLFTPATEIQAPGACGAHDIAATPYGAVSLERCKLDGYEWTQVASHEVIEMAVNPHLNIYRIASGRAWLQDICNMCVTGYVDSSGLTLSNFATPNWFRPVSGMRMDYTDRLIAPLNPETGGYAPSYAIGEANTGT